MKKPHLDRIAPVCLIVLMTALAGCSGKNDADAGASSGGPTGGATAAANTGEKKFTPKKIETAFGVSLGADFDPSTAIRKSSDVPPVHEFATETTYDAFKAYGVKITPTSKKICNIVAHGIFPDMATAEKELARLLYHLELKYGKATQGKIQQGNRAIEAGIRAAGDKFMLHIDYSDDELNKTAEEERNAAEAK